MKPFQAFVLRRISNKNFAICLKKWRSYAIGWQGNELSEDHEADSNG